MRSIQAVSDVTQTPGPTKVYLGEEEGLRLAEQFMASYGREAYNRGKVFVPLHRIPIS